MRRWIIGITVAVVLVAVGVFGVGYLVGGGRPATLQVTIDARDPASGLMIDPVNVWKDYENRGAGIVGRIHHGDTVGLIRQSGGAARIRLSDGAEGWVNATFIRELR